jgi:hypothetical protein
MRRSSSARRLGALALAGVFSLATRSPMAFGAPPKAAASAAAPAAAPTPTPAPAPVRVASDVESAERFYSNLDYENANTTAQRALSLRGLTHDQLVRAYRVLALSDAVLDKEEQARDAFIQLLTYSPDFQVDPNLGPRVTTPFVEARGYWRSQPVKPGLEVVPQVRAQETGVLRVTTRDPTHVVQGLSLSYRWSATQAFSTKPVAIGEGVVIEVSEPPVGATRLDYYVQAFDERDNVVMEVGTPASPKSTVVELPRENTTPIEERKSRGFLGSSGFWLLTTVVLGGGGAAAYFLLRPKPPTSASLTGSAQCGTDPCR